MAVRVDAIDQSLNIRVVDMASGVITEIENRVQRLASTHEKAAGGMSAQWKKLRHTWGAAVEAFEVAWALADEAAKLEQAQTTFNATVSSMGLNAEAEFSRIRQMSAGLIDDKALYEASNRALSAGVPMQQLGSLLEISRAKAREMGMTAQEAFDNIVNGIGQVSPEMLKQTGLVVDEEKAYETYARSINKTVSQLSTMDKQQALVNATINSGQDALNRQNLSQLTARERMQQLTTIFNNLKTTIGSFVIDAGFVLYGLFQGTAAAALALFAGLMKIGQGYEWLQSKLSFGEISKQHAAAAEEMRINAEAAWNGAKDLSAQAAKNITEPFVKARQEAAVAFQATSSAEQQAREEARRKSAEQAEADRRQREEKDKQEIQQALERERAYYEASAAQRKQALQQVSQMVSEMGGEKGKGLGMMLTGIQGIADYSAGLDQIQQHYDNVYNLRKEQGAKQEELNQIEADKEAAVEKYKSEQKLSIASSTAGTLAGIMYTLAQTQGKHSRAAFSAYKAFAIAQTVIDTYKAAQGAYTALASIPIVGPALGAAAAAAAIMAGMARVKAIRAQQPGGSASAASEGSGGGSASSPGGMPTSLPSAVSDKPAQVGPAITLVINGKETHIGELTGNVLEELYRNNGSVGGFTVSMERSA